MFYVKYDKDIKERVFYLKGETDSASGYILNLSANPSTIIYGNSSTITATLTLDGEPLVGESISFSIGGSVVDTGTTDSNGQTQYTYVSDSVGTILVIAEWNGISNSVNITVNKKPTTVNLSTSSSTISVGTAPSLSGTLVEGSTGLVGENVKIYESDTLIDTVTTTTGGAFTFTGTATTVSGLLTYKAVYEGTATYGSSTSSNVLITVTKLNTLLNIDVPLVLVYGDEFNITGTLTDANSNLLSGKTVDLYVGSSKVDTGTTDSYGEVEFTRTPVSMGTHTFQLKFDGDNAYANSDSSTVTRDITKETSVLTLTSPLNNSTIYTGESVTVNGTLTDNDGVAMPSKTIVVSENGNTLTTFTTNNNGSFNGQLTGLSVATHSLKFEFVADDYYTGSNVTRTVNVLDHSYSLSLTGTSIIQTGDTDTITATLTRDGVAYSGVTLDYEIVKGSTVITSGTTSATDNSGQATITYTGTGVGDVDVIVSKSSMLLQEIYELEDCIYFHTMTSADSTHWTIPSNANASYNSNGMKLSGSGWADSYLEIPLTKPYSVEFDITEWSSSPSYLHYFWDSTKTTRHLHMGRNESVTYFDVYPSTSNNLTYNIPQNCHIKFEINNDNAKLYVDNDLKLTKSYTMPSTSKLGLGKSSGSTTRWKNIKIKPL